MIKGIVLGVLGITATGILVFYWSPDAWWKEAVVVSVLGLSLFVSLAWMTKRKKWGFVLSIFVIGLLVFNRFGILGGLTFGLWAALWLLISLVN